MLVEGVGNPQSDLSVAFGEADTSVQGTVERLAGVVLLRPVDASCSPVVGIEGDMVKYCVPPQSETVLPSRTEGVLRNERYVTPVIGLFFAYHVIGKRGIRVSVVGVQAEGIGHLGTYRRFRCSGSFPR